MTDINPTHQLDQAWRGTDGHHVVRCICGAKWRRWRLADAAVALERHIHQRSQRRTAA